MHETEALIIVRILAGESNLFQELIRPYERSVYVILLAILKNEADAEDAAQETFIKSYRQLGSFRFEAKFKTWLISIALNEGRARLRKIQAARLDSIEEQGQMDEGVFTPALLTDWREIPSEALERKELRETLFAAIESLPPIYRDVLTLRDVEELDVRATAQLLGTSENLVKVRLHRARTMLQRRLVPLLKKFSPARKGLMRRWLS